MNTLKTFFSFIISLIFLLTYIAPVPVNGSSAEGIGLYRFLTGEFILRNSASSGSSDHYFRYGDGQGYVLAGDWNSDGKDGLAVSDYSSNSMRFALRNKLSNGAGDYFVDAPSEVNSYPPDWQVLSGNFVSNDYDSIAYVNNINGRILVHQRDDNNYNKWTTKELSNKIKIPETLSLVSGNYTVAEIDDDPEPEIVAYVNAYNFAIIDKTSKVFVMNVGDTENDFSFDFGSPKLDISSNIIAGDFNGDQKDELALVRSPEGEAPQFLVNNNWDAGGADYSFSYGYNINNYASSPGAAGDAFIPLSGYWGKPTTTDTERNPSPTSKPVQPTEVPPSTKVPQPTVKPTVSSENDNPVTLPNKFTQKGSNTTRIDEKVSKIDDFTLDFPDFGQIQFKEILSLSDEDFVNKLSELDKYVLIGDGYVEIKSDEIARLDIPASIILRNIDIKTGKEIRILKDGKPAGDEVQNVNYDRENKILSFDVEGFSKYEVDPEILASDNSTNNIEENNRADNEVKDDKNNYVIFGAIIGAFLLVISIVSGGIIIYKKIRSKSEDKDSTNP